jgi:hypothetical protein
VSGDEQNFHLIFLLHVFSIVVLLKISFVSCSASWSWRCAKILLLTVYLKYRFRFSLTILDRQGPFSVAGQTGIN